MVTAKSESRREVVRIKWSWPNLNLDEINGHGQIWIPRERYLENFDIFEAKEIGLNVCGQIWIPRERYFENFDIFEAKEIRLNGRGRIWIPKEMYFENFDFWGKRNRIKGLQTNLNLKREVFWKFWYFEVKEIGLKGHDRIWIPREM